MLWCTGMCLELLWEVNGSNLFLSFSKLYFSALMFPKFINMPSFAFCIFSFFNMFNVECLGWLVNAQDVHRQVTGSNSGSILFVQLPQILLLSPILFLPSLSLFLFGFFILLCGCLCVVVFLFCRLSASLLGHLFRISISGLLCFPIPISILSSIHFCCF